MTSLKCRAVVELGKGQIDVGLTWASCYCLEKLENPSILALRENVVLTEILPVLSEGHTVLEERSSYHSLLVPWFSLLRKLKAHLWILANLSLRKMDKGELGLGAEVRDLPEAG